MRFLEHLFFPLSFRLERKNNEYMKHVNGLTTSTEKPSIPRNMGSIPRCPTTCWEGSIWTPKKLTNQNTSEGMVFAWMSRDTYTIYIYVIYIYIYSDINHHKPSTSPTAHKHVFLEKPQALHPWSLTARPWNIMLGRRSFPFGIRQLFRGELSNFGGLKGLRQWASPETDSDVWKTNRPRSQWWVPTLSWW